MSYHLACAVLKRVPYSQPEIPGAVLVSGAGPGMFLIICRWHFRGDASLLHTAEVVMLSKVLKLSCAAPVSALGGVQGATGAGAGCKKFTKPTWLPQTKQSGCIHAFNLK